MYQLYRNIKRNPLFWDKKIYSFSLLGFFLFSCTASYYNQTYAQNYDDYFEIHPHTYEEKLRQWTEAKNLQIRNVVLAKRAELDKKLREEANYQE
mmetsp:Transcript_3892/g.3315  ORF Transcript_3892/g.3315 Transcript_3892/m.3315 type:complete len:95 (+) Transcript_3892:47-331(+)